MNPNIGDIKKLFVNRSDVYAVQLPEGGYRSIKEPLTDELIQQHLKGKITIGVYQINQQNQAKWICWDFDIGENNLEDEFHKAKRLFLHLKDEYKLNPVLEFSGKKGFHVWLFCKLTDAYSVQQWAMKISDGYDYSELFPKQTELKEDLPLGSLVKMPLGKHQESGHWSHFFDPGDLENRLTIQEDSLKLLGDNDD